MRGLRLEVDHGQHKTFPVYVPDVAQVVVNALEMGRVGHIYNVADLSINHEEINQLVNSILGIGRFRLNTPRLLLIAIALILELIAKITHREPYYPLNLRHYVFNDWMVQSSKARQELLFTPTAIEDGLRQTIAWYKEKKRW